MDISTTVILAFLAIAQGVMAIATFVKNNKKDNNNSGYKSGVLEEKIEHIDKRTLDIQHDIKDMKLDNNVNSQRVSELDANMRIEHERTSDLLRRIEHIEKIINKNN